MMKHKLILLISILTLGFALSSCAPDPVYSYPPEYQKPLRFTLDKPETVTLNNQSNVKTVKSCNKGDMVTVFLPVTYTGSYITSATYYWTIKATDGSVIEAKTIEQTAPHKQDVPPMWSFTAPGEPGTYRVHFRARYEYSAQTESGTIYGGYPTNSNYEGASTINSDLRVY